jgi:hypothetical protein
MSTPDQYRYYLVGEDWYRVHRDEAPVEFWDGDGWRLSVLPDQQRFLEDALGSGAKVREVLDPEEVPRVHS